MIRRFLLGIGGGAVGGTAVGISEALWILSNASTGEYIALVYGAILYALIGAALGAGVGVGLVVLGMFWKGMSDAFAWTGGFFGVFCALGLVITRYVANKVVYLEQGVPMTGMLVILAVFVVIALVGLWLGPLLLGRTPLGGLAEGRGTLGALSALILVSAVFGVAPGRGDPDGVLSPDKPQTDDLSERPDIVLIMVDTLRADHLGAYGDSRDLTPHLDKLAAEGIVFEKGFTSASWTRASTASLFTGMVPSSHSCDVKVAMLPDDVVTIAEVLSEKGYATGGLPNNINVTRSFNFQQGFDWFSYQAPSYIAGATESASQLSMYNVVRKGRDRLSGGAKHVEDYYQPADVVFANAQRFIEANEGKRAFTFIHLMEPHDPYFEHPYDGKAYGRAENEVPDAADVEYLRETYAGEIKVMDTEIGKFLDWLRASGRYENTVIVVTADHGEEFLEHGGWWHGTTLYDEQLHVPMVMKLAGTTMAGARADWQVRQIDIAPTLAMLSGAEVPATWQGHNLLDQKFVEAIEARRFAAAALAEATAAAAASEPEPEGEPEAEPPVAPEVPWPDRDVLSEENFEGNVLSSLRSGGWKYIRANEGNPRGLATEELYNVGEDASEAVNLAGVDGPKQAEMAGALREMLEAALTGKVAGQATELTEADKERLKALGYMEE